MFGKKLKYYRLKNNLTKETLASMAGISPLAINLYENGEKTPDMNTIKTLARVLGIRVSNFLYAQNTNLAFVHNDSEKSSSLSKSQREYIVEEYFGRFFQVVEVLGENVLPKSPVLHSFAVSGDPECDGMALRKYMGLPERGPVGNLIKTLENSGVLVYTFNFGLNGFLGMNGTVNGRPYVVANKALTAERIRAAMVQELIRFAFSWPGDMTETEAEKYAVAVTGAFLFPKEDVLRELGVYRSSVTSDMYIVCREYGISLSMLVARAHSCNVIDDTVYQDFIARTEGKEELSRIAPETSTLFKKLVYRAVNEQEFSVQKGAELLEVSYNTIDENCKQL